MPRRGPLRRIPPARLRVNGQEAEAPPTDYCPPPRASGAHRTSCRGPAREVKRWPPHKACANTGSSSERWWSSRAGNKTRQEIPASPRAAGGGGRDWAAGRGLGRQPCQAVPPRLPLPPRAGKRASAEEFPAPLGTRGFVLGSRQSPAGHSAVEQAITKPPAVGEFSPARAALHKPNDRRLHIGRDKWAVFRRFCRLGYPGCRTLACDGWHPAPRAVPGQGMGLEGCICKIASMGCNMECTVTCLKPHACMDPLALALRSVFTSPTSHTRTYRLLRSVLTSATSKVLSSSHNCINW